MATTESHQSLATAARRCSETRRVMLNAWRDEQHGRFFALDLMGIEPQQIGPGNLAYADTIRDAVVASLVEADLYLADEDMTALIDTAAPTMPDQVLDETDPISAHGWLWFAEEMPDRTGVGPAVPFKALQWSTLRPGDPLLAKYIDQGPMASLPDAHTKSAILIHTYSDTLEFAQARMAFNRQPGKIEGLAPGAPGLTPSASVIWIIGSPIGTAFGRSLDDLREESGIPEYGADPGFYQRLAAAFWTLAKQPLSTTQEAPAPSRSDRRRLARAGVSRPDQAVRILRLRHSPAGGSGGGGATGRKVGVRFAVRGHWRQQWYRSVGLHRQIWIDSFVKGPEDAPLAHGERVFLATGKGIEPPHS